LVKTTSMEKCIEIFLYKEVCLKIAKILRKISNLKFSVRVRNWSKSKIKKRMIERKEKHVLETG